MADEPGTRPFVAFNFSVEITLDGGDPLCAGAFSECDGLEMSQEVKTIREGGNNGVQVKLTSSDGKPLSAARVTVRFFMAGMPEMGMAEMNVTSQLTERGSGVYNGEIELGSGGTFQVTVSAEQAGKAVLTKRVNLTATGGK